MKHIVGFSGGIDSQACARWVLNRYPAEDVILLNSNAGGNEHPLTEAFVAEYSQKVHPVTPLTALVKDVDDRPGVIAAMELDPKTPLTFVLLAKIMKRFPSRRAQICTQFLKNAPARRWAIEHEAELGEYERYSGKRRDESESRASIPVREWSDYFDVPMNYPIMDWTKQMCFDYVKAHKEPINPLYSLGFERVGCAPCINSGKDDMHRWADRFPEMVDKIRTWEQEVGSTFFPPKVPGMEMNFVDDFVAWSRTDHGGRQFNILNGLERPACESKFGLCE